MSDTSPRRLIVRFYGGLGNQIFQYAAGLYFSERISAPLDIVRPHGAAHSMGFARPFQLDEFALDRPSRPATRTDRFYFSSKPVYRSMQDASRGIARIQRVEEPTSHHFLPTFLDHVRVRTIYLIGHFQVAAYAESIADRLRNSLQLRSEPQQRNLDYAKKIRALKCPVSVHIRIGDYALHTAAELNSGKRVTWVLRKSYYREAIARIRTMLPEAELVVFSDDPAAAQAMMDGEQVSLWVKGNTPANAFEELWLMSCCRHHVIANSTFSWWGAWMNPVPNKVVLAPKYWFNIQDSYYPDLFPATWNVIDNLA